ncbi:MULTISPECIES: nucleotidyltransferase domain-containing protein [Thermoanaerobacterium]|uniref:Uncharacterized protein n=2 Tax=Thermoanaerobacterium TaxID=28895 RepID=W9E7B5_9THEO|nr:MULTISPECIES: hypothetical protein [Thermoanaerobacterium]AFK86138.1 hypothetical protein Tsac_1125 [Thermoanaerobacterium saccharolyticum JW/SL-YS485]ETO37273.1 hypothetical protein V518_2586 [Thermoanaerobacterium aotearoense SCUT27]
MNVLRKIYEKLNDTNINWVITGSTAFAIQGIPFKPNDVDIQTDKEGAYKIEECFKEFVIAKVCFSSNGKISSHFGRLEIDGIKVEIMGDIQKNINGTWEEPVNLEKYKRYITLQDMRIPVLDLEYECEAYLKMGRVEKVILIKKYINQMKNEDGTIFSFDGLN